MSDDVQFEAYTNLKPDIILDAIESVGFDCDGRLFALNSYENRVYQIGIEDQRPLIAKFYRPHRWTDDAIIEEHFFTHELKQHELPVVAPILMPDGKSLHVFEEYRFALYPSVGGRSPELDNAEHLKMIGRFLGRIHSVGAMQSFGHREKLDVIRLLEQAREYLLRSDLIPFHLTDAYESLMQDLITKISLRLDAVTDVTQIRLHGDCHPGNILWSGDVPTFVDFDDSKTGPSVQDLWMFLSGDDDYLESRLDALLEGYTQFRDFDMHELKLIEILRTARLIGYQYWIAMRWSDPAFPTAFPWFDSDKNWEEHILTLREQMASLDEPDIEWKR